ncbi:AraC family transcriptional regulator [Ornithinimicrobium cryptoxanthini]|uniref:AraC family transcriptional regulator n=1 Tax=Ornithinimicrobium cryptoxanthini TaxID=2934161 RepID=A0ABY4YFF1_9MICO|nr:helix-turn-helix domain-containing protein [Ornithinimicrobium cryptoxanthini]USQ75334.1 AraC family transcriptional regulator [Ornithinimicrobium cryptoxanthini]
MHGFGKNPHPRPPSVPPNTYRTPSRAFEPWEEMRQSISIRSGLEAFRWLPDVHLFIKDRERRLVHFSPNFPAMMGRTSQDLIGARDEDLSPEHLVEHYRLDDNAVLTSGIELPNIVELVAQRGAYAWNITSKWPIHDSSGEIVAVGGVTRRLQERPESEDQYLMLQPAVELMVRNQGRNVPIVELAAAVSLSPSQFSRVFQDRFGMTPHQYLRRLRMDAAADLLTTTDLPLTEVASRCGYYDQSHMSNEFRKIKHMPPGAYRARYRAFQYEG